MPYTKYVKRSRKGYVRKAVRPKRIYHSRRRSAARRRPITQHLGAGKQVFPDRLKTKMTFNFSGSLPSSSGSIQTNTFKLNALWKPEDTTGGTTQPRYFDSLFGPTGGSAPYIGYRVYGVKAVFKTYSNDSVMGKVAMGARDDNSNAAPSTLRECSERVFYQTKLLGGHQGGNNVQTISRYFDLSKVAGVSRNSYMTDDDFRGTWTTNPAELIKLDLLAQGLANQTKTVYYDLTLHFYVQCLYASDVQTEVS